MFKKLINSKIFPTNELRSNAKHNEFIHLLLNGGDSHTHIHHINAQGKAEKDSLTDSEYKNNSDTIYYFKDALKLLIKIYTSPSSTKLSNALLHKIFYPDVSNKEEHGIFQISKNKSMYFHKNITRGQTKLLVVAYFFDKINASIDEFKNCFFEDNSGKLRILNIKQFKLWLKSSLYEFKTYINNKKFDADKMYSCLETSYIKNIELFSNNNKLYIKFAKNSIYSNILLEIDTNNKNTMNEILASSIYDKSIKKLTNSNYSNRNLSNSNFSNSKLSNIDFNKSNLSNSNFSYSILNNADFTKANLTNSNFFESEISNTKFTDVIFKRPGVSRNLVRNTLIFLKQNEKEFEGNNHSLDLKSHYKLEKVIRETLNDAIAKSTSEKEKEEKNKSHALILENHTKKIRTAEKRVNEILFITSVFTPKEKNSSNILSKSNYLKLVSIDNIIESSDSDNYIFWIDISGKIHFGKTISLSFLRLPNDTPVIATGIIQFDIGKKCFTKIFNYSELYCPDSISLEVAEVLFCFQHYSMSKNLEKNYFNSKIGKFSTTFIPSQGFFGSSKNEKLKNDKELSDRYIYRVGGFFNGSN